MDNKRALIVEDEAIVALEIRSILEKFGFFVVGIENNGQKAIEKALEEIPDIILMDINLKGNMDGIEASSQIQKTRKIPTIFLTAYAEDEKLERAKLTLPYGYLLKPFHERDLKVSIEMALFVAEINKERDLAQKALQVAHQELEEKIKERTEDLRQEIDERKQIEEHLQIAKEEAETANQAKSLFLANISHELRNPMHHIMSYANFGTNRYDKISDEKRLHYFEQIKKSSFRLMTLLDNLLDLSKLEAGRMEYQFEKHEINTLIEEVISEIKSSLEEKQLIVEVEKRQNQNLVTMDKNRITQVLHNILSNTIKFSSEKQSILITIEDSQLQCNDMLKPSLKISVSDQGIGIPENELDTVFDKFVQSSSTKTNAGGTGLGLAICKEIILAHQGKIWAENNPTGGATFSFEFPIKNKEMPVQDD